VTEYFFASAEAYGGTERVFRVKEINTKWILRCQCCGFVTLYTASSISYGHKWTAGSKGISTTTGLSTGNSISV
jgi:hypothetical protein